MKKDIYYCLLILMVLWTKGVYSQSTWIELNPPLNNTFNNVIISLASDTAGNIYAAGDFRNSDNKYFVAKWDGRKWKELGSGTNAIKANNSIYCIATDKQGNVYAAGSFTDSTGKFSVAKWNGTSWSEVGTIANALHPNGQIYAMTTDNQGNLYVSGNFKNLSGKHYVAKWNGISWLELGTGINALNANGAIVSLAADTMGNLYAAGSFTNASQKYYVAKWDGTVWTELTGAAPLQANAFIGSVKTDNNGNVYAVGAFTNSNGYYYVAKWNGVGWEELGTGANSLKAVNMITDISISSKGKVYAGCLNTIYSGYTPLLEWNGTNWTEVTYFGHGGTRTICLDNKDNVYAAGEFKNKVSFNYVAKWDGSIKSELGFVGDQLVAVNGIYKVVVDSKKQVYTVGQSNSGSLLEFYIAQWDGKTWKELGGDTNSLRSSSLSHFSFAADISGNLFATGFMKDINGNYFIAKWDGYTWIKVIDSASPVTIHNYLTKLTSDRAGNIYAYGDFSDSEGNHFSIMKWDGRGWKTYKHVFFTPSALFVDKDGTIYAGSGSTDVNGWYYVEVIDTNTITRLGTGANALQSRSRISDITVGANGLVFASGVQNLSYGSYDEFVAKWDGTSWSKSGSDSANASGTVYALTNDTSGNVYAVFNSFNTPPNPIIRSLAKWNGNDWIQYGSPLGMILSVTCDYSGNVYIGGLYSNGLNNHFVALYGKKASWVGGSDNIWSNPANWSNGQVPDSLTDVTIDNTIECIINIPSVCRTLNIASGSKLTNNSSLIVLQQIKKCFYESSGIIFLKKTQTDAYLNVPAGSMKKY